MYYDNRYPNTASTAYITIYSTAVSNNVGHRFQSRAERELEELLRRFKGTALETKLRRKEANRKAMSDVKSRQHRVPARGRAPMGARLQTYEGALFARMAPKKYGG